MPDNPRMPESDYFFGRAIDNYLDGNKSGCAFRVIAYFCVLPLLYDIFKRGKNEIVIYKARKAAKKSQYGSLRSLEKKIM